VLQLLRDKGPTLRRQVGRAVASRVRDVEVTPEVVSRAVARLLKSGQARLQPVVTGRADASRKRRWIRATAAASEHLPSPSGLRRTSRLGAKQVAACTLLCASPDGIDAAVLRDQGIGSDVVRRLLALGLAQVEWRAIERDPFASGSAGISEAPGGQTFLPLTTGQEDALGSAPAVDRPAIPDGAPARRHGQRQDAGLPAAGA
jgi:hypothetical protein